MKIILRELHFLTSVDRTLEANFELISGIADNTALNVISIYPNPDNGNITVSGMEDGTAHLINLSNFLGQLVEEYTF